VQLTESAIVEDVDDQILWCGDFNRRVCRGDGLWAQIPKLFFFVTFFFSS